MEFEWMDEGEGWELADTYTRLGGRIIPFDDGPGGYVGIAVLQELDGRPIRTLAVGRFQSPKVAEQAVEEQLVEWYEEEAEEARMEQRLYEREQGWRR